MFWTIPKPGPVGEPAPIRPAIGGLSRKVGKIPLSDVTFLPYSRRAGANFPAQAFRQAPENMEQSGAPRGESQGRERRPKQRTRQMASYEDPRKTKRDDETTPAQQSAKQTKSRPEADKPATKQIIRDWAAI